MKKNLYIKPFRYPGVTRWECPSCSEGVLNIIKESFSYKESKKSRERHFLEEYTPYDNSYLYSCLLSCQRCNDIVSNSGVGGVEIEHVADADGAYTNFYNEFYPRYFSPNLKLFKYPKNTDKEVTIEINKSFSLFFSDPSSSSNHIRIALEKILDFLKIKKTDSKNNYLSLHKRIEEIPAEYEKIKDHFIAIKHIGNAGSHSDGVVNKNDVFDAYEIMEELLNEIFHIKPDVIKNKITEINKTKKPRNK